MTKTPSLKYQKRRARENKKKLEEILGPIPDWIKSFPIEPNISYDFHDPLDDSPVGRAPAYMIETEEHYIGLDQQKLAALSEASAGGRKNALLEAALELRARYPQLFGKRGGPREIAEAEAKLWEGEGRPADWSPIKERTVRKYVAALK